jgi:hypothetical protein
VVGVIAGGGVMPRLFARGARARGVRVVAVAHVGESDPDLERDVDALTWVHVGELGRLRDALRAGGVQDVALCGGIRKTRLFEDARPDEAALALLVRLDAFGDDAVLRALAGWLEAEGLRVIGSTGYLGDALLAAGDMGTRPPTREERADVAHGLHVARALGGLDVGQCVVVKGGVVLAVEAIEGTDACLRRGGALGRGGAVAVKIAKPGQDLRFDLPAIGPGTLEVMREAGIAVLAGEAGRTLCLEREGVIAQARAAGLCLYGLAADGAGGAAGTGP